jgi:hypothetical protein
MINHITMKCMLLGFAIGAMALHLGCGSKMEAPTTYERWVDEDGAFSIDYPADWSAEGGGKNGVKWAEFSNGTALIKLDFDTTSSIIGDIAGSQNQGARFGDEPLPPEIEMKLAPVHKAHEFNKDRTALLYSDFQETAAEKYTSGLGDSRKSEFVSSSLMGSVRGYRSTALTINQAVIVVCSCSASDWETLKPAFDKILASLGR